MYISLFDFLGHAAGPELGMNVALQAAARGIPHETKTVNNNRYKGDIKMYPKEFLEEYFKTK